MKVEIRGYTGYIRSMEITSDTSEKWSRDNVYYRVIMSFSYPRGDYIVFSMVKPDEIKVIN